METEFVFWRHDTSAGIRVEEICGGEDKSVRLWKAMALQVFGENGGDRFREITHLESGAPLLEDTEQRISVSHTPHFMVIAMLPRTPEADLGRFSPRTAMGIDCEPEGRAQVLRVAERVMTPEEMRLTEEYARSLQEGSGHTGTMEEEQAKVTAYVLAWTVKEALYKAALTPGLDFRTALVIEKLPGICENPFVRNPRYGVAAILFPDYSEANMELFSYRSEGHIVTIAYSPKCAKFKKHSPG
ncbi:MAG: 4'-phosphopantetheinyl transferase superfamily protein [Muribaculaceae bacterium]|nr:4'-phosphopantetheinyl transferase superfamily protein [Muribaculaceae bacterium]